MRKFFEDQPLIDPNEAIDLDPDVEHFEAEGRIFDGLGRVHLTGTNHWSYKTNELGLTVIHNQIITRSAQELDNLGFFGIDVAIIGDGNIKLPLKCSLYSFVAGLRMDNQISWLQEDENEDDPRERFMGSTFGSWWHRPADNLDYVFFAPPGGRNLLNSLRFSISREN
jgi:hypothetical protein